MVMPEQINLSERAAEIARGYIWTLLPGSGVAQPGSDLSPHRRRRGLHELKRETIVTLDELGCFLPPSPRVRFLEPVLTQRNFTEEELSWLLPGGLGNILIEDFGKLEMVNATAPLYATGGWKLHRVHWYEHQPMIAAAEYHHPDEARPAYAVFCWATVMDNERELCERLGAIREAIQEQAVDPAQTFWPAGLVVLGAIQWAVARAMRLARSLLAGWVEPGSISGWHYANGEWYVCDASSALTGVAPERIPTLLPPITRLRPSVSTRKLGGKNLERVIADSLWAGRQGQTLCALLTTVGMYPVGAVSQYQWLIGEHPKGKEIMRRMKVLGKRGMVEVVTEHGRAKRSKRWPKGIPATLSERGRGTERYALTRHGRAWFCYAHGGRPADLFRRTMLGRRWTLVRQKVITQLLTLSWTVHLLHAPSVRPVDLSYLAEVAGKWKKRRRGALVHLLTLACMVHLSHASRGGPVQPPSLAGMERFWRQLRLALIEDKWLYRHEDTVYDILGQVFSVNYYCRLRRLVLPVHLLFLTSLLSRASAVAGHVKLQDDGVVDHPVNRRGGGHGVGEDALPLREDQVGGDAQRSPFVAFGDEGEKDLGLLGTLGQVAQIVQEQEVEVVQFAQLPGQSQFSLGGE